MSPDLPYSDIYICIYIYTHKEKILDKKLNVIQSVAEIEYFSAKKNYKDISHRFWDIDWMAS